MEAERDARQRLFESLVSKAQALRSGPQAGRRCESLETLREAVALARAQGGLDDRRRLFLRNEVISCLGLADLKPNSPGIQIGADAPKAASASRGLYVVADAQGLLEVHEVDADRIACRLAPPKNAAGEPQAIFSRDGRYLAATFGRSHPPQYAVWEIGRAHV